MDALMTLHPANEGVASSQDVFAMTLLTLKRQQCNLLQSQREKKEELMLLKQQHERLEVSVQALAYELEIHKVRRQQLENYPKKSYLDLLNTLPQEESESELKSNLVQDQSLNESHALKTQFNDKLALMQQEFSVMQLRLEGEFMQRESMISTLKDLEKVRQRLREQQLKERTEWNTFKINFKGLAQVTLTRSDQVYISFNL